MRKWISLIIVFAITLFFILLSYSDPIYRKSAPAAQKGFLDLSAWNFSQDGLVKLSGEWECYDGQLLSPADFSDSAAPKPQLTGYANPTATRISGKSGGFLSPKGARTFRLVVATNHETDYLGLRVDNIKMSNKLYIDGKLRGSSGTPALNANEYQPKNAAYNIYFSPDHDQIEILLQSANYDFPLRGLMYTVLLGEQEDISLQRSIKTSLELSGAILCFLFGLYYLFTFFYIQKSKSMFFSFVEFFLLSLVFLTTGEKMLYSLISTISFEIFAKIQVISFTGVAVSIIVYTNASQEKAFPNYIFKPTLIGLLAYIVLAVVTPYSVYSNLLVFSHMAILWSYLFILYRLASFYKKVPVGSADRINIILYMLCLGGLTISFINGSMSVLSLTASQAVGSAGFCIFAIFSLIFLVFRFSVNYHNMLKMDKVKDEFITKTSYELKAPLGSIVNISEAALASSQKGTYSAEENIYDAAATKNIALRLLNVVNSTMDITLLTNDQLVLTASPIDIRICVELVLEGFRNYIHNEKIIIISTIHQSIVVRADERRVRQVLWNLLLNSVKSMEQGTITLSATRFDEKVFVSVQDTGCGIPEEKWEEIFNPYTTLKLQGIGLGLYLSRLLIERMGGKLWLEWSEIDKGSLFIFSLPYSAKKADKSYVADIPIKEQPHYAFATFDKPEGHEDAEHTVLVVDDEMFNMRTASSILQHDGYRVLTAFSGDEALKKIEDYRIDLVILDIMMPGTSGISICKKIRDKYSLIELPVLLSTVGNSNYNLNLGMAAGANDFIFKPFEEREIASRVRTLIALKTTMEDAIKSELAFLQAQIKPHFLYNAINTIVSFCYTDGKKAASLLTDFSKYLRLTFEVDNKVMMIPLRREIEMISAYTQIEKARFGEKISVEYDVDPMLLGLEVPPLCIQPLVENAIKHGLLQKGGGCVTISAKQRDGVVLFEVKDTGIGMSQETILNLKNEDYTNKGVGISNVSRRIRRWGNSNLDICSTPGEGTTVTISVQAYR
ncbi:ATP-binding protein [Hydrogenoanaerobacterium sp.]|uniref:ATP-binding protein n=1 Tax=Hydrogenoanaerobacterium sp. TaxID=2953763 RepID=UPI0028A0CA3C|nr:ATP-binding protein [Hydrogenoanaerobacterium sp.]